MDLFARFKKDYFNYLLSVIIPAFIMGVSIPVLKHFLGAGGYGNFSIWLNAVLLCTASLTGWITQSILRFSSVSSSKVVFAKQSTRLMLLVQAFIFLPAVLIVWLISGDVILAGLFAFALAATSVYFSTTAIGQSGFLSKKNIYSETIRVVSYIGFAFFFLLCTGINFLYGLFISIILSYLFSAMYMRKQVKLAVAGSEEKNDSPENIKQLARKFFHYGAPLSVWFVFSYMASYIDKLFVHNNLGAEAQGNYQAIFDLLSRTLVVLMTPVLTSLFPLLTLAYRKNEVTEIKRILKKIILLELLFLIVISILYWWFGANILMSLLNVPATDTYKMAGFMIIAGTFVWLIASVAHKGFELRLQSRFLMPMIAIGFLMQLAFYLVFQHRGELLIYPAGYLLSGLVYLCLVIFFEARRSGIEQVPDIELLADNS